MIWIVLLLLIVLVRVLAPRHARHDPDFWRSVHDDQCEQEIAALGRLATAHYLERKRHEDDMIMRIGSYAETHHINVLDAACLACKKTLADIHATRIYCGGYTEAELRRLAR